MSRKCYKNYVYQSLKKGKYGSLPSKMVNFGLFKLLPQKTCEIVGL